MDSPIVQKMIHYYNKTKWYSVFLILTKEMLEISIQVVNKTFMSIFQEVTSQ